MGGFYGRSLTTIPIAIFDKIVDPGSGRYIACYESLGISKEKEEEDYLRWGPIAPSVIRYLCRSCGRCRELLEDKTEPSEKPSQALLGGDEQLGGLEWIRTSILNTADCGLAELFQESKFAPIQRMRIPAKKNSRSRRRREKLGLLFS